MANDYQPAAVERGWYDWWEQEGLFAPTAADSAAGGSGKPFTMVLPPPNVTGALHIGALLSQTETRDTSLCMLAGAGVPNSSPGPRRARADSRHPGHAGSLAADEGR